MPLKTLAKFDVKYLQVMNEKGEIDKKLMPKLTKDQVRDMYKTMVLARIFDDKALKLQRQGRLGTYASGLGQEAAHVASAFALDKKDWMFPAFRENAAMMQKGYPMHQLLLYWGGDERGNACPKDLNIFPISIPVGSQIPHAVGAAWGMKMKKEKTVSLVYFGDGATSEGDFHEAMNFAGVFKVPCVFVCMNNQWAISVPRSAQSASQTLAQKAIAYGFEGVQVDGNDVFAVYSVVSKAIEKARKGEGPTLIECYTFRMSDHTTADDASRYVDPKVKAVWSKKDPIDRLKKYMMKNKIWSENDEKKLVEESAKRVDIEVERYETYPPQKTDDIFNYMYSELTPELREELEDAKKYG